MRSGPSASSFQTSSAWLVQAVSRVWWYCLEDEERVVVGPPRHPDNVASHWGHIPAIDQSRAIMSRLVTACSIAIDAHWMARPSRVALANSSNHTLHELVVYLIVCTPRKQPCSLLISKQLDGIKKDCLGPPCQVCVARRWSRTIRSTRRIITRRRHRGACQSRFFDRTGLRRH